MIAINVGWLRELGLPEGVPGDEVNRLLSFAYERLQLQVGMKLAGEMNDAQLDEFEVFSTTGDDTGAFTWLERNLPSYKEIIEERFDCLSAELRATLPSIVDEISLRRSATVGRAKMGYEDSPP